MKKIQLHETKFVGKWLKDGKKIKVDRTCERIDWLVNNVLKEIGYSKKYGAWETLYLDPEDGRYWLKIYPKSHMHGGGPPTLMTISKEIADKEFDLHKKV